MTDPRPFDDEMAINRVWNALVGGFPAAPPTDPGDPTDRSTTETLQRLHALGAAPPPASSRERVRRGLQATDRPSITHEEDPMSADALALPIHPNSRPLDAPLSRPIRQLSGLWAALLLVALVGAIVAGTIVTYRGPSRPERGPAVLAPASPAPTAASPSSAVTSPSPAADLTSSTLVEFEFPADVLPTGDTFFAAAAYKTFPIGGPHLVYAQDCCGGPFVQHVVTGEIAVTVEGPAEVIRAGGATEALPASTEVLLVAGDTLVTRSAYAVETVGRGLVPPEVVEWLLVDPTQSAPNRNDEPLFRDLTYTSRIPEMPGPVHLKLRREVVQPDDYVATAANTLVLPVVPDPEVHVIKWLGDFTLSDAIIPTDTAGEPTVIYVFTMTPLPAELATDATPVAGASPTT